mmetsp:Transcript_78901/g.218286  ORF Transcript_78901/g.218286 Transcript_78901/m.218286 type:complete len:205 (+) Transcript_78901:555-1169(+)
MPLRSRRSLCRVCSASWRRAASRWQSLAACSARACSALDPRNAELSRRALSSPKRCSHCTRNSSTSFLTDCCAGFVARSLCKLSTRAAISRETTSLTACCQPLPQSSSLRVSARAAASSARDARSFASRATRTASACALAIASTRVPSSWTRCSHLTTLPVNSLSKDASCSCNCAFKSRRSTCFRASCFCSGLLLTPTTDSCFA